MVQLSMNIKKAETVGSRLLGLMFRKSLAEDEGLHIIPCNGIHMFFMRFPIDVVFLDREERVVKIVENLRPWRIVPIVKGAYSTLELPVGSIQKHKISIGNQLIISS